MNQAESTSASNFLRHVVEEDLAAKRQQKIVTRFPPEPNGYLHIGHAKSICINFGLANDYNGNCHLRFDDTNPEKESDEYIRSITEDVRWLGFEWTGDIRYASDYFDQLYTYAVDLIEQGLAYVCDLSADEAREHRGTLTEAGKNSPYRNRSPEENIVLFEKMRGGEFEEGHCVLRAKIDMASPNMNLRDPIIYRIRKVHHHQTGDRWCIYPTYDFTHGQSDAIEGVTHSICTLEFEDHRPLYEWFIENLPVPSKPKQYEFARLNLNYTITSKRKLKRLVEEKVVDGWDDPRMPTIAGMRRRGFSARALRAFCASIGVSRSDSTVDVAMLEHAVREDHNANAPRAMAVLRPLKMIITNYPKDKEELLEADAHPSNDQLNAELGSRKLPFTRELYIDRDDFRESANKKFKRLVLGKKVRLRNAYVVTADSVVKDEDGHIIEVHVTYDMDTLGADPADGVKPKGVIQWVSAGNGQQITVRLYDRLFLQETPDRGDVDFMQAINPDSLEVLEKCWVEPGVVSAAPETVFQFEREGYFVADRYDHSINTPVFNRTIALRDTWQNKSAS